VKVPLPKQQTVQPSGTVQNLPNNSFASTMVNDPGTVTWQGGNFQNQVIEGYSGNDIVYSIINLIVGKAKVAPWSEYEVVDEISYKKYAALMQRPDMIKDWKPVEQLFVKALKPVKTKTRISQLLEEPNPTDTWADFLEAWMSFKLITGNAYVYGEQITAGANKGFPLSLTVLPSQYMSILADLEKFPILPKSYQLYMQYYQWFTKEEILHDKYFNPNWNIAGNQLYGFSPLQAAAKVLTRSNEGKQAAVSNYQNGGPKGILFTADDRYDPATSVQEAIDIKKSLARNQGAKNVNQVETSGYKVGYVPLGLSPADLELLNAEKMDMRALCNVYGVPSQLMNDPEHKTYNTAKEGEKALTARCALPLLVEVRDNLNKKFRTDWGKSKNIVDFDPTVYQELQEDRKEQVAWLKESFLPLRRRLEVMGESLEGYTEEQLNTIFVPSGYTTLDDVMMQAPINPSLNDYDQ
jgi:HK97 family phage portal protein